VGRTHSDLCIEGSVGPRMCLHPLARRKIYSLSRNGTPISLGRHIRTLETVLTELPGLYDREQVTFVGWSWPVARSTESLFCLTNVATSHRLHKHTIVKFHLRPFSFFLALSLFLHSIAIRFFFCYTFFFCMAFILYSFLLFFCSLHIRNFTGDCKFESIAKRL